jgi:hypothetical protein
MKQRYARRRALKALLLQATQCEIQHTGWCCNACFHLLELGVSADRLHAFWQATLLLRGDYRAGAGEDEIDLSPGDLDRLVAALTAALEKHQQRALFA